MTQDLKVFSVSGCIIDPRPKPRPAQMDAALTTALGDGLLVIEHAYAFKKGAPSGADAPALTLKFFSGLKVSLGDYNKQPLGDVQISGAEIVIRPAGKQLEVVVGGESLELYSLGVIDLLGPLEAIELLRLGDNSLRLVIRCFGVLTGITLLAATGGMGPKRMLKNPNWTVGEEDGVDDVVIQVRATPSETPKEEYHAVEVSIAKLDAERLVVACLFPLPDKHTVWIAKYGNLGDAVRLTGNAAPALITMEYDVLDGRPVVMLKVAGKRVVNNASGTPSLGGRFGPPVAVPLGSIRTPFLTESYDAIGIQMNAFGVTTGFAVIGQNLKARADSLQDK